MATVVSSLLEPSASSLFSSSSPPRFLSSSFAVDAYVPDLANCGLNVPSNGKLINWPLSSLKILKIKMNNLFATKKNGSCNNETNGVLGGSEVILRKIVIH